MEHGISLIVIHDGRGWDVADLVQSIKWSGRKGTPTRQMTCTLIDDEYWGHYRSDIKVEYGVQVIYFCLGKELFRGLVKKTSQNDSHNLTFTAYDNGTGLTDNKDTFCYENKTADEVFVDVCTRFGIPVADVCKCSYVIPYLNKSKTSGWDAIADALGLEFQQTKIRHCVGFEQGKAFLRERRDNVIQKVIEVGTNITSYTYDASIENLKTRFRMVSKENAVVAERVNADLEARFGIYQEIDEPDEKLTEAQINDLIDGKFNKASRIEKTINVTCIGDDSIVSGVGVWVRIPELGIEQTYYVDEDVHSWKGEFYTMQLKLNVANDTNGQENEDAKLEEKSEDSGE